ncbi:MAG: peptide-methionine (R)-S-oxide reductase MsrB [Gammaproteobacteria bacterium]|nr:peptide-methionine (R)-S-oxide reductase MsrB [Gammaproteobacteria bacterium]
MTEKINKPEQQWRDELSDEQFRVLRQHGTEPAFTGKYHDCKTHGTYVCSGCGEPLFTSETKFDSGSGWPSYWQPMNDKAIETTEDNSHGMHRVEVHCKKCGGHLGHVFPDGPQPTGLRYCINSASLELKETKP